jgi:hypothetical protein
MSITVCASCLRASCWQGEFYCEDYQTADIVEKTRAELAELGLEHPSWWDVCPNCCVAYRVCGCKPLPAGAAS